MPGHFKQMRNCLCCGEMFLAKNVRQRYCHKPQCRRALYKEHHERHYVPHPKIEREYICKHCGATFKTKHSGQRYCKNEGCIKERQLKYFRLHRANKKNGKTKSRKPININKGLYARKCLKCDKSFKTDNKFNRLCSDCRNYINGTNALCEDDY